MNKSDLVKMRFELVSRNLRTDDGPGKYRIDLTALSNDYVTERDFMSMRSNNDVVIYKIRVFNSLQYTVESLRAMAPHITYATSLLIPEGQLDVIVYSCTSGTAVMGYEKVSSLIQTARPNIACTTPLTPSLLALDRFDAQRITVLTPYVDDVNTIIAGYLEAKGKEIAAFISYNFVGNEEMTKISPECIYQAALDADRDDAGALFISCTAIRAVNVIEKIGKKLGKPLIFAVQAMFWQSMRIAGFDGKIPEFGNC
jgi:maleate isomerase